MKKFLLLVLLSLGYSIILSQSLQVKPRNIIQDSKNNKELRLLSNIQSLPYPIIFIHGLNSESATWNKMKEFLISKGLSYGGDIEFCLNEDGDNLKSNTKLYPESGADIALYTNLNTDLNSSDFYCINFDIDNLGLTSSSQYFEDMLSNEAAIVKQGIALKYAIQIVLQKTGREKVILMGHSMGGLAAREYLQNTSNWQGDGNHHVAKLITTGTPHGGYQGIAISLPGKPIDWRSEAYRDLRHSFLISGDDGVYLYGGKESKSVMNNNLIYSFYNFDVNCNGIINENITGLNQKPLPMNLDFAYIIGICDGCSASTKGDGVVREENANLNNFYDLPLPVNEFFYKAISAFEIHSKMAEAISENMQALDEPNKSTISYTIKINNKYTGFINQQSESGSNSDIDYYNFSINMNTLYSLTVDNQFALGLTIRIYDSNLNLIISNYVDKYSSNTFFKELTAGKYFLEISSATIYSSYEFPYTFEIQNASSIEYNIVEDSLKVNPNPFSNSTEVVYTLADDCEIELSLYNLSGMKVLDIANGKQNKGTHKLTINAENLSSGTYNLILKSCGKSVVEKVVLVR